MRSFLQTQYSFSDLLLRIVTRWLGKKKDVQVVKLFLNFRRSKDCLRELWWPNLG